MRNILILIFIFMLSLSTGCSVLNDTTKLAYTSTDDMFLATNFFVHPDYDNFSIKRVMLAPIKNESSHRDVGKTLEPIFIREYIKLNKFEIVPTPPDLEEEIATFSVREKGTFYALHLYDIGKRYNVDAIIFTSVTAFSPYEPCIIGINAQMISTYSGIVVWALNEVYDGNLRSVESLAKVYYYEKLRFAHPLNDWKIMMSSIRYFAQMVASDVSQTMNDYYIVPETNPRLLNIATMDPIFSRK